MSIIHLLRTKTMFRRFIGSYFFLLSIYLLVSLFNYNALSNILYERTELQHQQELLRFQNLSEQDFKSIEQFAIDIYTTPAINSLLYLDNGQSPQNIYTVSEAIREVEKYKVNNDIIYDFYIYLHKNDLIFTKTSKYTLENFYYNYIKYENKDIDQWKYYINSKNNGRYLKAETILKENKTKEVITYIQSISYGINRNNSNIIVLMNCESLNDSIDNTLLKKGDIYIVDDNNNIIYSHGNSIKNINIKTMNKGSYRQKFDDMEYVVKCMQSEYNEWKYISIIPYSIYIGETQQIKKENLRVVGLFVVIGIFLAFVLAYRNTRLIKRVTDIMKGAYKNVEDTKKVQDDLHFLESSASELIKENSQFKHKIEQQKNNIEKSVGIQLLMGMIDKETEIEKLQHTQYCVFIIKIKDTGVFDLSNRDLLVYSICNVLDELTEKRFEQITVDLGGDEMIVIANDDHELISKIHTVNEKLCCFCEQGFNMKLQSYIGEKVAEIGDIKRSYKEARETLEYAQIMGIDTWVCCKDIKQYEDTYVYNLKTESKLLNAIVSQNGDLAIKILCGVWESNFVKRKMSLVATKCLYYELYGTIQKIMRMVDVDDISEVINSQVLKQINNNLMTLDYITYGKMIEMIIQDVCCYMVEVNCSDNSRKDAIIEYIETNLDNPDMNLQFVAEEFSISTAYLSQIFKADIGENFLNYLRRLRIDNAKGMLEKTNLSIKEIAVKVGYVNSNVFIRNFKQIEQSTPGEYRARFNSSKLRKK